MFVSFDGKELTIVKVTGRSIIIVKLLNFFPGVWIGFGSIRVGHSRVKAENNVPKLDII